ncbi:MAG TPA: LacI family DNA-binding transcriptional regulator [Candidatus Limiplasma sp.]|nr:LacI family DNA-binding transcriptional regulator [Candidatus Limiplasma sp.]HPS80412.1 LacI family DNA-binding transcriptional regulator [Candidatus Limiplasma sp.]
MNPKAGGKRVVLQDIADATGYTVNTVSRALRNKPDIAQSTRGHIRRVADDMGYVQDSLASSLRSGFSNTLAVIVGGVTNPFYATMIDAIHDYAQTLGYTVLVLCTRDEPAQERRAVEIAVSRRADGILLCPSNQYQPNVAIARQANVPCVLLSRRAEGDDTDSAVCDEETGGYLAGMHLLEAGHRKLGFWDRAETLYSSERRVHGLLRAAEQAGIPRQDVHFARITDPSAAEPTLRQWKTLGVTGIFAFCDIEAWVLMEKLAEWKLQNDFALVGFDNIQGMLGIPTPLCTVDGAMRELTVSAVRLLLSRIQGNDGPARHLVFPARLVCRGSCQKPDKAETTR